MPSSLEDWQNRLDAHFCALAVARTTLGYPLFALEHGLAHDEIEEIAKLLRSRLTTDRPLATHWLLWVVYATELGYDYDGDEYWQSFEERTPHWRERASRPRLRSWFSKFQATYQGVIPSGPWADWFSIIAWPITHAILPKYLQLQFARTLHGLRYRLASLDTLTPSAIGRLLSTGAWDASSRFREFLQQEELAGRIVIALLSDRSIDGQSPIHARTLERIASDLERVWSAREWLKEARRVVAERFKGTGRAPVRSEGDRESWHAEEKGAVTPVTSIRPTLLLRRSGALTWSAVIEVPNFSSIAKLNPDIRTFLRGTRCRVAGTGDTWLPAGWLLSSTQKRVLKAWPDVRRRMVEFERPHPTLDHLLDSECRLTAGPVWLCRIRADGIAVEIAGRIVRAGQKYVVLSGAGLPSDHRFMTSCHVECDGINAGLLSLPDTLSLEDTNWLQQRGLQVARNIRLWSAGLGARAWDGEGHSEWITTEAPCFGVVHDHPIDAYIFRLDQDPPTVIDAGAVGQPVFVRIPPLAAGRHSLSIKAQRAGVPFAPQIEGFVTLEVREPEPWVPGTTSHTGLVVYLDPHDPSLDTFWEGNVAVSILGPEGHQVTCSISLSNARGEEILSQQIGIFDLPIMSSVWSNRFDQFVSDENYAWKYLEAASGRFIVIGDELGQHVARLERDIKPLRWVCRSAHHTTTTRLIDDTGQDESATAEFLSFRWPATSVSLEIASALVGLEAQPPGGLYIAQHGEHRDALIVSSPQVSDGFRGLVVEPDLRVLIDHADAIGTAFHLLEIWNEARLVGPLAGIRRDRVIRGLVRFLYSGLCGSRWSEAEATYLSNNASESALQRLERSVGGPPGFAIVLRRDYEKMEAGTGPGTQWFADAASRYHVCSEKQLCEFALRLASQPHRLSSFYGENLAGIVRRTSDKTVLLRGARLVALLAAVRVAGASGSTIPRWKWQ